MKALTREFTPRERMLLVVLGIIIVGLVYYLAVDQTVRAGMRDAKSNKEALEIELSAVNAKVENMRRWKAEMDRLGKSGRSESYMPSYNASKEELDFLNETLSGTLDYYIGFNDVTREGDQIRRSFSLNYSAASYQAAVDVLYALETSDIRCLIGDFSVSPYGENASIMNGPVTVNATATFYETMYEGTPDKELPEDLAAPEEMIDGEVVEE